MIASYAVALWRFAYCPPSLDFPPILCHTYSMTTTAFNRSHLISALYHEYQFLCHDDFDPDVDPTPDEYLQMLQSLTDDELIDESSSDDLDEYIRHWL